jgi:hypothetical protein
MPLISPQRFPNINNINPSPAIELTNMPTGVSSSGYVQYGPPPNPNFGANETQPRSNMSSFDGIEDNYQTPAGDMTEAAGYDFEGDYTNFPEEYENSNVLSQYNNTGNIGSNSTIED